MRKKNRVSPDIPTVRGGWDTTAGDSGVDRNEVEEQSHVSLEEETAATTGTLAVEYGTRQPEVRGSRRFKRYSSAGLRLINDPKIRSSVSEREDSHTDTYIADVEQPADAHLALLHYFITLSDSKDEVDFTHIDRLILQGADVLATDDSTGRSIMHEVAETWDTTVAEFMCARGVDLQHPDASGKTPLHIAACINNKDMLVWLIKHGADLEAKTNTEKQTPVHYAARNDSMLSLQALIELGGNYEVRDYKGRTPLHLAAELDRTVIAEYLLSLDQPAKCTVYDNQGNHVISTMLRTMPQVAVECLNQLHKLAPAERKQFYMLDNLERKPGDHALKGIKSPFEMAVEEGRYDFLTHEVMRQLIQQKWTHCVRWYYYFYLGVYVLFLLSWSVLISYPSVQLKHLYVFPTDIWRVIVELIAVVTYVHQMVEEALEVYRSKRKHKQFTSFRTKSLEDDLANVDISLPEEKDYLQSELTRVKKSPSNYFKDPWNVLDLFTYFVILVVILLHIVDVAVHTTEIAIWAARISCLAVLLMWIRILKLVRAFRALGPLIAIIGELIADILRYFALYTVFFIPYMISTWVIFGGDQALSVTNNEDLTFFHRVAIVLFRISVIDSFPYPEMRIIDEFMAAVIVLTFLIFTAIIGLNLFIALLSDTFQRVYDNAQANALLQQARIILLFEDKVSGCTYTKYLVHIQNKCSPLVCFYDDDEDKGERPGQLQKITHQIYTIVSELEKDRNDSEGMSSSIETLRDKIEQQDVKLSQLNHQLVDVRYLLLSMQQKNTDVSIRSPPTLDDHDEVRLGTKDSSQKATCKNLSYVQRGQSCQLSQKRKSDTTCISEQVENVTLQRRSLLTPILAQPTVNESNHSSLQLASVSHTSIDDTLTIPPQRRQQNASSRLSGNSHSSPILDLPSGSNSSFHDQHSNNDVRSFSTPWLMDNYNSASEMDLNQRSAVHVAKTHRWARKKK